MVKQEKKPVKKKETAKKPVSPKAAEKPKKTAKPPVHKEVKAHEPEKKVIETPQAAVPVVPLPLVLPQSPQKKKVIIDTPDITVKDLSDKMSLKVGELIKALMKKGVFATINQRIDVDTIKSIVNEFDMDFEIKVKEEAKKVVKPLPEKSREKLVTRHPVVTIMGHVDHGKTKLLDTVRKTNVIATESGGITQHIGAYQVEIKGRKITFLDTPGHEAFTALRARGARVTDIVVLVVAADEGVKPQTVEALDHARAAGVPVIVAINKIDKPEANLDRVKKQLAELDLTPEDWGGSTVTVPISAKDGLGIDELLDMILLLADMQELKAAVDGPATGVVVESKLDKGRGPVATILIKSGTLRVGEYFAIGATSGKIRAIIDDKGRSLREAGPSSPVEILGISEVPAPGDILQVVSSDKDAKSIAEAAKVPASQRRFTLETFSKKIKEGERKDLNLIIKADVQGSLEAISSSLEYLRTENIHVRIIHGAVGNINESDIMLAEASQAIVIGFHVAYDGDAKRLSEDEGVDTRLYDIIYNLVDDVKLAMEGLLEPEYEEVVVGLAEVRQLFRYSKVGTIAGCFISQGKLLRGTSMRIKRGGDIVWEGRLESLKRFKEDVREVEKGYECGVSISGYNDFKIGDVIETYEKRVKARKASNK